MRSLPSLLLPLVLASASAAAQPAASQYTDQMPMQEYLALVEQVAPAAREGAQNYISAFRARCGREIRVGELRSAFAEGDGDPVLMGMIRAAFSKDTAALTQLRASLPCPRG